MSRRYLRLLFALCLTPCLPIWSQTPAPTDPTLIGGGLFIGQIYPSGNVYLRSFVPRSSDSWPQSLLVLPLLDESSTVNPKAISATLNSRKVLSAYIPALEGMDDDHPLCSLDPTAKKDAEFRYLSKDFFSALFDHCDDNKDLAIYRSMPSLYSVKVLAFAAAIRMTDIRSATGPRPVTPQEEQEVSNQRRKLQGESECTSTPAFIDSATRIAEAGLGDGLSLRLSSYQTPGCAGHLVTIYIADILRGEELIRSFQVNQIQGQL
jgi:hypothetical protein